MEEQIVLRKCLDHLETITSRLAKLNNMITSLCLGMEQENLEQQAIDCVESIGYCVNDIRTAALDGLREIQEMPNKMNKKE